jgi:hypothetical protein
VTVVDAASRVGNFEIIPNLDMSIIASLSDVAAANLTLNIFSLLKSKSALAKTTDGRYIFGAFLADKRSAAWYSNLKARATAELGIKL